MPGSGGIHPDPKLVVFVINNFASTQDIRNEYVNSLVFFFRSPGLSMFVSKSWLSQHVIFLDRWIFILYTRQPPPPLAYLAINVCE